MSTHDDAARILTEYETLAASGSMASRRDLMGRAGLGWSRFLDAHHYLIRNLLVPAELAVRYDPRRRMWTAGAERYNGAAGFDEFPSFIRWHGQYLRTRSETEAAHLKALASAFPAKARTLRPVRRYVDNAIAELDEVLTRM